MAISFYIVEYCLDKFASESCKTHCDNPSDLAVIMSSRSCSNAVIAKLLVDTAYQIAVFQRTSGTSARGPSTPLSGHKFAQIRCLYASFAYTRNNSAEYAIWFQKVSGPCCILLEVV